MTHIFLHSAHYILHTAEAPICERDICAVRRNFLSQMGAERLNTVFGQKKCKEVGQNKREYENKDHKKTQILSM